MTDKIVVLSTCPNLDEAERLARLLVERRLAACVNVAPGARSFYRWQGRIESAEECLLIIKSSRSLYPELNAVLEKEHSYQTPESIALPILDGSAGYMNWLAQSLPPEGDQG